MTEKYFAALDLGGSKADAVLFREDGSVVSHIIGAGGIPFELGVDATLANCKKTLDMLFESSEERVETLYASVATVEFYHDEFMKFFRRNFNIPSIRIEGDGCCLISAELGHSDGCGLICGTGSSLYIRQGDSYYYLGGGGAQIDSCGSGFVLGQRAIRATLRARDGSAHETLLMGLVESQLGMRVNDALPVIYEKGRAYIASFAKNIFEARKKGDITAREIFNACASDLADVIWAAYAKLHAPFSLVFNGGIFANYPEYAEAVRAMAPSCINVIFSSVPPVYGCAVEAMHDAGIECTETFRKRFLEDYKIK